MYDGWETRRRRGVTGDAHDAAIIRLSVPAVVRGAVVDTAWFTGNYPPQISVEAAYVEGHPPVEELVEKTQWTTIIERSDVNGDTRIPFGVNSSKRWSHVRMNNAVHGYCDTRFSKVADALATNSPKARNSAPRSPSTSMARSSSTSGAGTLTGRRLSRGG